MRHKEKIMSTNTKVSSQSKEKISLRGADTFVTDERSNAKISQLRETTFMNSNFSHTFRHTKISEKTFDLSNFISKRNGHSMIKTKPNMTFKSQHSKDSKSNQNNCEKLTVAKNCLVKENMEIETCDINAFNRDKSEASSIEKGRCTKLSESLKETNASNVKNSKQSQSLKDGNLECINENASRFFENVISKDIILEQISQSLKKDNSNDTKYNEQSKFLTEKISEKVKRDKLSQSMVESISAEPSHTPLHQLLNEVNLDESKHDKQSFSSVDAYVNKESKGSFVGSKINIKKKKTFRNRSKSNNGHKRNDNLKLTDLNSKRDLGFQKCVQNTRQCNVPFSTPLFDPSIPPPQFHFPLQNSFNNQCATSYGNSHIPQWNCLKHERQSIGNRFDNDQYSQMTNPKNYQTSSNVVMNTQAQRFLLDLSMGMWNQNHILSLPYSSIGWTPPVKNVGIVNTACNEQMSARVTIDNVKHYKHKHPNTRYKSDNIRTFENKQIVDFTKKNSTISDPANSSNGSKSIKMKNGHYIYDNKLHERDWINISQPVSKENYLESTYPNAQQHSIRKSNVSFLNTSSPEILQLSNGNNYNTVGSCHNSSSKVKWNIVDNPSHCQTKNQDNRKDSDSFTISNVSKCNSKIDKLNIDGHEQKSVVKHSSSQTEPQQNIFKPMPNIDPRSPLYSPLESCQTTENEFGREHNFHTKKAMQIEQSEMINAQLTAKVTNDKCTIHTKNGDRHNEKICAFNRPFSSPNVSTYVMTHSNTSAQTNVKQCAPSVKQTHSSLISHESVASLQKLNPNSYKLTINDEIAEEMARAQSMLIPVNFDPIKTQSLLDPNAEEFCPQIINSNGNSYVMVKRKGICFFRPEVCHTPINSTHVYLDINVPVFETYTNDSPSILFLPNVHNTHTSSIVESTPLKMHEQESSTCSEHEQLQVDPIAAFNDTPVLSHDVYLTSSEPSPIVPISEIPYSNDLDCTNWSTMFSSNYHFTSPDADYSNVFNFDSCTNMSPEGLPEESQLETSFISSGCTFIPMVPFLVTPSEVPTPATVPVYNLEQSQHQLVSFILPQSHSTSQPLMECLPLVQSVVEPTNHNLIHAPVFNLMAYVDGTSRPYLDDTNANAHNISNNQLYKIPVSQIGPNLSYDIKDSQISSIAEETQNINLVIESFHKSENNLDTNIYSKSNQNFKEIQSEAALLNNDTLANFSVTRLPLSEDINVNEYRECTVLLKKLCEMKTSLEQFQRAVITEPADVRLQMQTLMETALNIINENQTLTVDEMAMSLLLQSTKMLGLNASRNISV